VTALDAIESASSGSFSRTERSHTALASGEAAVDRVGIGARPRGHTSNNRSTNGNVTSIGFAISPSANRIKTSRYRRAAGRRA
jgi:hypothetical protein